MTKHLKPTAMWDNFIRTFFSGSLEEPLERQVRENEVWPDVIEKTNESLIGIVKNATKSEIRNISVKSEKYSANILVYKGDLILDGIKQVDGAELKQNKYEFGNKETDIGTESEDAKNMVILKIDDDLTVN